MKPEPRITLQTLMVLKVLLEEPSADRYGLEIADAAHLATGSVYPILIRLEKAGWLASYWESADPSMEGRPRRRFYRLTGAGAERARRILQDLEPSTSPNWGRKPWTPPTPEGGAA